MISVAAGLAKTGFIPVVDTFAQFGVTKGALPLIMSSLSHAPVIAIFSHIGFQDAADGASHQALNYLGFTLGIPHVEVWSLSCAEEAESLITQAISEYHSLVSLGKTPPSYVFFLGRENFPVRYHNEAQYQLRSHQVYLDGNGKPKALIIAMGSLVTEAFEALATLKTQNIDVSVIHPGFLSTPNLSQLTPLIEEAQGRVIFVEDHQKTGGFAEHWISVFVQNGIRVTPRILGVSGNFGQSAYQAKELYAHHGISAEYIVTAVKSLMF
jgi:transketolase